MIGWFWELGNRSINCLQKRCYSKSMNLVKDNWNSISKDIGSGYKETNGVIDFDFIGNKYYSLNTSSLYASYLNENFKAQGRSKLGMNLDLKLQYLAYKIGILNGNPVMHGVTNDKGNWSAAICEDIAYVINTRSLLPNPILPWFKG